LHDKGATGHVPINKSFTVEISFKNWHFVLPEDGTLVQKHAGKAHLILVFIKTVHLDGTIKGAR